MLFEPLNFWSSLPVACEEKVKKRLKRREGFAVTLNCLRQMTYSVDLGESELAVGGQLFILLSRGKSCDATDVTCDVSRCRL
jgi:hypothetical protein